MIAKKLRRSSYAGASHFRGWKNGWRIRSCWKADADAGYAAVIEIDLAKYQRACPVRAERSGRCASAVRRCRVKIDEVFIGSCTLTIIGPSVPPVKLLDSHKGQLPTRLWVAPPTRMDAAQLTEEGYYSVFGRAVRAYRNLAVPVYG